MVPVDNICNVTTNDYMRTVQKITVGVREAKARLTQLLTKVRHGAVVDITHGWLYQYNEQRPHDALGGLPPSVYRQSLETKTSTSELSA